MSIHSYDGKSWKTKLELINKLSMENSDLVFNNLGHLIDLSFLKEVYYQLGGTKAIGIDNVTKTSYGNKLDDNLADLLKRIRRCTYKPKPAKLVEIPKEDGSKRPLAISCLEDKIVQSAVSQILNMIYEPLFLSSSYGFRPDKSCHEALRALNKATYKFWNGAVVEIDLCKCFNTIPHEKLMKCLQKKISDKRLLKLIFSLLKTPTIKGSLITENNIGCPQGSIISPILANIYLHDVIDEWFYQITRTHLAGKAEMVRYCDDMVFIFQQYSDAERFYKVLPKRLDKYGLLLNAEKSHLIKSGHREALKADLKGKRLPTYKFLGFTCYWGKTRNGYWRLKYTSRQDRFTSKLKGLREHLWKHLNAKDTIEILNSVATVLRGWINYHGISDNDRRVKGFITKCKRILYKWYNRRGRKKPINWQKFERILNRMDFPTKWKTISMF